jgi:NTE family protein
VLGGGGVTGVAWELGLLAGLAEAGLDLTGADVIVGTSAGSVVAVQIASDVPLERLYEAQLESAGGEIAAKLGLGAILRMAWSTLSTRDELKARARIGVMAVSARTVPAEQRREVIASRLPIRDWPDRDLRITAVSADTGEFFVIDRAAGVSLVDAVGASCAVPGVWPAVRINGRPFMDGGMRSPANVDVAAGCDRVIVIAPISTAWRPRNSVTAQAANLPADTRNAVISPDQAARAAIGRNLLDPARRAAAARAGRHQARNAVDRIARVWND